MNQAQMDVLENMSAKQEEVMSKLMPWEKPAAIAALVYQYTRNHVYQEACRKGEFQDKFKLIDNTIQVLETGTWPKDFTLSEFRQGVTLNDYDKDFPNISKIAKIKYLKYWRNFNEERIRDVEVTVEHSLSRLAKLENGQDENFPFYYEEQNAKIFKEWVETDWN